MRFDISQSLYPDGKVRFIARDNGGVVRIREDSLEELQKAITKYNETLAAQALEKAKARAKTKGKGARAKGKADEETTAEEIAAVAEIPTALQPREGGHKDLASIEEPVEQTPSETQSASSEEDSSSEASAKEENPVGELLQNDLKEQVEGKKKKTSGKGSFWDKLK